MKVKKKIRLKAPYVKLLKVLGVILVIVIAIFLFYRKQINEIKDLGYSEKASNNILFNFKKDYVLSVGENKTLNAAFESPDFIEDNLEDYSKIDYVKQDNLIRNINKLIKKGYMNSDISLILKHGSEEDVANFAKRDKVKYLEEFLSINNAKLSNYDRYLNYSYETGEDEETTVLYVNLNLDKTPYEDATIVEDFSYDMVVNKYRGLNEDFVPNLVSISEKYASDKGMKAEKVALNAFIKMAKDAEKAGLGLVINSSYRSYQDQVDIAETYQGLYGDDYVTKYVAKPGFSEHQTGLAFDIGSTTSNIFANSKEYTWMLENAYKYGFILRFPQKYEDITGFRSEPWHYRYVGTKISKYIYENDITLEEYYALFLDK